MEKKSAYSEKEVTSYVIQMLTELMTTSFNELLRISDKAMVNTFCKIISKTGMNIFLETYKKQYNVGKELTDIIGVLQIAQSCNTGPENLEVELREYGAVGKIQDCLFKNFSSDFCTIISHYSAASFCELINPEYESIWLNRMTEGAPFCSYIIKERSISYNTPDDLGKVIRKFPPAKASKEEFDNILLSLVGFLWIEFTVTFNEIHGNQKTMEILGHNARQIGLATGTSLIKSNMLPARDAGGLGQLIDLFEKGMEKKGTISTATPNLFSKEINACPFKDGPPELCKQLEAFNNGICQALNPGLEFKYSRMMSAKEPSCLWVITKK